MFHEFANSTISGALTTSQALFVTTTSRIFVALTMIIAALLVLYAYAEMRKSSRDNL